MKPRQVLIFDEATRGLDEASAEHIGQTVNALKRQVTVVFVAHKVPGKPGGRLADAASVVAILLRYFNQWLGIRRPPPRESKASGYAGSHST